MPNNPSQRTSISKALLFTSVCINTLFLIFILRMNQAIEDNAALLNFLAIPHLSSEALYRTNPQQLQRSKVESLITAKPLCFTRQNIAYKFQFKESGKLFIYLSTIVTDKIRVKFLKRPSYIVPYEVSNSAISWNIPLPGSKKSWRFIHHVTASTGKIYLRNDKEVIAQEICSYLSKP